MEHSIDICGVHIARVIHDGRSEEGRTVGLVERPHGDGLLEWLVAEAAELDIAKEAHYLGEK